MDPDDVEMLEDLIMAAVNEALRQVDEGKYFRYEQADWRTWRKYRECSRTGV